MIILQSYFPSYNYQQDKRTYYDCWITLQTALKIDASNLYCKITLVWLDSSLSVNKVKGCHDMWMNNFVFGMPWKYTYYALNWIPIFGIWTYLLHREVNTWGKSRIYTVLNMLFTKMCKRFIFCFQTAHLTTGLYLSG